MSDLTVRDVARLVGHAKYWHGMRRRVEAGKLDSQTPVLLICDKAGHVPDGRIVSSGLIRGSCARCGWTNWIRRSPGS